ncbi:MAG TPA: c-type cytochrome [Actinomycetota bacterium]|nr:c-type cytochrome [Actinomycetota bacterium]
MAHSITEPTGPVADVPEGTPGRKPMPFFPDFALVEAITALCYLVVLLILAAITEPSLEEAADPTASGYVPRPEWYFMWAFQSLKYFKGESEMLGTFVIPTIAIALLVAVPFIDRRERPKPLFRGTRPIRLWPRFVALIVMAGLGALTYLAMSSAAPMTRVSRPLTAAEAAGQALYGKLGCSTCHTVGQAGGDRGPDLSAFGSQPDANERVLLHFTGIGTAPDSVMPGYQLSEAELRSLAEFLLGLQGEEP